MPARCVMKLKYEYSIIPTETDVIADIVAILVSEEARWLAGQEICANCGVNG